MRRKIIKQGIGGHTIFLPIKWVRANNLQPGDEVELSEQAAGILVQGNSKAPKEEVSITLGSEDESAIRILITNLYRLNYTTIKITYSSQQQVELIHKTIEERMLGFEVTRETKNSITIESITEPSQEKEEIVERRIFQLISQSYSLIQRCFTSNKGSSVKTLREYLLKVDKYCNFLRRKLNAKRYTQKTSFFHWSLYGYLLQLEHSIVGLTTLSTQEMDTKILLLNLKTLESEFQKLSKAYFHDDIVEVSNVQETLKSIHKKILTMFSEKELLDGKTAEALHQLAEQARGMYFLSSPLLSITSQRKYQIS